MKRGRNAYLSPNVQLNKRARIGVKEQENAEKAKEEEEVLKNIKIHPLLQMPLGTQQADQDQNSNNDQKRKSKMPPKVKNPLLSDWKHRDGFTINPYINQSDLSIVPERKSRTLRINEPGKQIERANNMRQRAKQERLELERKEELKRKNLIPDESIGEDRYGDEFEEAPPYIEWWDAPFLKNGMRSMGEVNTYSKTIVFDEARAKAITEESEDACDEGEARPGETWVGCCTEAQGEAKEPDERLDE
ncbi:hypothetical protein PMKS-002613 [Pichia membranifaciens]|uniref:Pre-mRNA-splicing factor 3 domain-containing protein n=1 Tax=Pichia membranifaciens TaxID=4926 RepID=A0A1Q2YIE1_9ASCO|nr:hypothetical protein PMKS-002613 [Pichia membranifaciens]